VLLNAAAPTSHNAAVAGDKGGQWISPARVRRAVEATAAPLGNGAADAVLTYGRGLLQVCNRSLLKECCCTAHLVSNAVGLRTHDQACQCSRCFRACVLLRACGIHRWMLRLTTCCGQPRLTRLMSGA
jgi:hypothetical protein